MLFNISRSKENQTKKVSQLQEYKIRDFFLEKAYIKCAGKGNLNNFATIRIECISGSTV